MVVQLLGDRGLEIAELVLLILRRKVASWGTSDVPHMLSAQPVVIRFGHLGIWSRPTPTLRASRRRVVTDGSKLEMRLSMAAKIFENTSAAHAGRCSWTTLRPLPSRAQIAAADDLCNRSAADSVEPIPINVRSGPQL
jgi:hypothetical protein